MSTDWTVYVEKLPMPFIPASIPNALPKSRHGSWEPWRPEIRAQSSLARCRLYLATPFRPFGEPGNGVFKYGKIGK